MRAIFTLSIVSLLSLSALACEKESDPTMGNSFTAPMLGKDKDKFNLAKDKDKFNLAKDKDKLSVPPH